MGNDLVRTDRAVSTGVHPFVGATILGLVLWLVISVWGFASGGYSNLLLVVVTGFMVMAVAIPYVLWRVWRTEHSADERPQSFHEWRQTDFDTWPGPVKGTNAAIEILLPIAAVAFGMTAFAIVLFVTTHTGV